MKKLSFLFVLLFLTTAVLAQKSEVRSASSSLVSGKLDSAKEAIDKDLAANDPDTEKWDKAWYIRGQVYENIASDPTGLYRNLDNEAVFKAYEAYLKTLEYGKLDKEKYNKEVIEDHLPLVKNLFINYAVDAFETENYEKALEAFEKSMEIDEITDLPYTDTAIVYNAGLAAANAGKYNRAIELYDQSIELGYGGANTYYFKASAEKAMGDTLAAENTLKAGIDNLPAENDVLIVELVNLYLLTQKIDEAMVFLDLAIEKEPDNASFYFAKGTLYNQKDDRENEEKMYLKAIEFDPEYYDALYNLGALYLERTNALRAEAADIPLEDKERYNEVMERADKTMEDAIPYLESALEIKPDDRNLIITLREIYTKLKETEKAEEMDERLEEIGG